MTDNRDKILKFLCNNRNKSFDEKDLKKECLKDLNTDKIKKLVREIKKFDEHLVNLLEVPKKDTFILKYNGNIDDFLASGGVEKIEKDSKKKPLDWYKIIPIILTVIFGSLSFYQNGKNTDLKRTNSNLNAHLDSCGAELNRLKHKLIEDKEKPLSTTSETKNSIDLKSTTDK